MRQLTHFLLVGMLFVMSVSASLRAEVISHREIGLEIWIPDDWKQGVEDKLLEVTDPDETVKLLFIPSELQYVDHFSQSLARELSRVIDQPEVDREKNLEINGLFHYRAEGIGLYKGALTDWALTFVTGPRKCVMIVILGDAQAHQETLETIYRSMQLTTYELEEPGDTNGVEEIDRKPASPPPSMP